MIDSRRPILSYVNPFNAMWNMKDYFRRDFVMAISYLNLAHGRHHFICKSMGPPRSYTHTLSLLMPPCIFRASSPARSLILPLSLNYVRYIGHLAAGALIVCGLVYSAALNFVTNEENRGAQSSSARQTLFLINTRLISRTSLK